MFISLVITHGLKKIKPEQIQIINILIDFFFIKAIFCSQYNQKKMIEEKVIEIEKILLSQPHIGMYEKELGLYKRLIVPQIYMLYEINRISFCFCQETTIH